MRAILAVVIRLLAFVGKELVETLRRPGAIVSLVDTASGMAVWVTLDRFAPLVTQSLSAATKSLSRTGFSPVATQRRSYAVRSTSSAPDACGAKTRWPGT